MMAIKRPFFWVSRLYYFKGVFIIKEQGLSWGAIPFVLITASSTITRVIAIMAFCTSSRGQVGGMTITARGVFMVNTVPVATARVRAVIIGAPIAGIVTLRAVRAKQS
jgi:hypothetical protein